MQLNSHMRLGKILAREYRLAGVNRAAFLAGNVEPDLLFTTHLCKQEEHFEGHSFPSASQKFLRLCYQLQNGCETPHDYFKLGQLCHYTADCFTWPHNPSYPGTLSAHISYEAQLDKTFRGKIQPVRLNGSQLSCPELFMAAHEQYMKEVPSITRDLRYILAVTGKMVHCFAPQQEAEASFLSHLAAAVILPECKEALQTVREIDGGPLPRLV